MTSAGNSWLAQLAEAHGVRVTLADGRAFGPASAAFSVRWRDSAARLLARGAPSPLRLGEAWIDGAFDLDGDIFAAMHVLHRLESATPPAWLRAAGALRSALRPWRDAARDIAAHYDLPAEFYATFLDRRLVYTCAYYRREDSQLDEAQQDKLELVCRKLRLERGHTLLDVGCGWGALACWAAAEHGARVHAVTLSRRQAEWATERVAATGLSDRVTVEHRDYRDLPAHAAYDRIAAIGIVEHLGRRQYPQYFGRVAAMLADDGLFLNHGITMRAGAGWSSEMEFLDRHVFPGLDLVDVPTTLGAMEAQGLEILDVENLRPHYARTTRDWATRLWANRQRAVEVAGERAWRVFVAYLAAASVAFESGWIGLAQVVAQPAGRADDGRRPVLREEVYFPAGSTRRDGS